MLMSKLLYRSCQSFGLLLTCSEYFSMVPTACTLVLAVRQYEQSFLMWLHVMYTKQWLCKFDGLWLHLSTWAGRPCRGPHKLCRCHDFLCSAHLSVLFNSCHMLTKVPSQNFAVPFAQNVQIYIHLPRPPAVSRRKPQSLSINEWMMDDWSFTAQKQQTNEGYSAPNMWSAMTHEACGWYLAMT